MQKQNVQIGKNYVAKIDDSLIVVKIDALHKSGGWIATDIKTDRQMRIPTPRKLKREATPAEVDSKTKSAQDRIIVCKPTPDKQDKKPKLTPDFAYETWRKNNMFPGLFIFEQPEGFLLFGDNATLAAEVLKRQKLLDKKSFTFSGKKKTEYALAIKQPEVFGIMKNLAKSGNTVLLITQKKNAAGGKLEYEISKHILAGRKEIIDGMPPRDMVVKKAEQCTYRVRNNPTKPPVIQHIDIKPGETFKSQSGNEYFIQMVSETAVYAQQIRDGKPTGPTRPFDKKSVEAGLPKGLRGEDSYYPKSEALEAAEKVLQNASGPMTTKAMMIEIRKRKLWFTTARMPHTTLAAAIARDMKRNGQDSRFIRLARGLFQLANKPVAKQQSKTAELKTPDKDTKQKPAKTESPKTPATTKKAKSVKKAIKKVVKKAASKASKKTPKTKK